jgi:hypothetical protein
MTITVTITLSGECADPFPAAEFGERWPTLRKDATEVNVRAGLKEWIAVEKDHPEMVREFREFVGKHTASAFRVRIKDQVCTVCDKPARTSCSRCSVARYCSKKCQGAHWKKHKKLCKKVSAHVRKAVAAAETGVRARAEFMLDALAESIDKIVTDELSPFLLYTMTETPDPNAADLMGLVTGIENAVRRITILADISSALALDGGLLNAGDDYMLGESFAIGTLKASRSACDPQTSIVWSIDPTITAVQNSMVSWLTRDGRRTKKATHEAFDWIFDHMRKQVPLNAAAIFGN